MKRVLTFLAIMLLPLSVMAMTPVTDSDLAGVTGQAGVNINADLTMNVRIGTMAWGDSTGIDRWDGAVVADAGGYIGITGFNIENLRVRARETDTWNNYHEATDLAPITIDVATGTKNGVANTTFVRFGLGSLEISMNSINFTVKLGTDPTTFATSGGKELGSVYLGDIRLFVKPGSYVDIYNDRATGAGVTMDIDVTIDRFIMSTVSWGDSDGITTAVAQASNFWIATSGDPGAGFIGLGNLLINGPIVITGTVTIDVASISNGKYALTTRFHQGSFGNGVVHIGFGGPTKTFVIDVQGAITGAVRLAANNTLTTNMTELGDIYISGLKVELLGSSWVDIWAH